MSRFDPIAGKAYGECVTCGATLQTSDDAAEHRQETFAPTGRSHTTRGLNRTRSERIQSHIDNIVSDAIQEALDVMQDDINRGDLSTDEVTEALNWYSDFAGEWSKK